MTLLESYNIDEIQKKAINGDIKSALVMAKDTLKENNSSDIHILYARLLFWNKDFDSAKKEILKYKNKVPKLYKQIYIAWGYKRLSKIKNPKKAIKFYYKLPKFVKDSYDILWIMIDANIKLKRFKKALYLSKKLVKKYPKSQEAQERLATLLFWNSRFKESLKLYKKLYKAYKSKKYKRKIKQLSKIVNRKKVNSKKIVIKKIKAKIIYTKNIKKIIKKDKYMIGMGIKRAYFLDNRYKDLTKYIEGSFSINGWNYYLQLERTNRYKMIDDRIYAEIYPNLHLKSQWGYLSLSYTPNADFFSKYSIGWHHFYSLKNWEFGGGIEFNHYTSKNTTLLNLEGVYYFTQYIFLREVLYYVPQNGSYASSTQIAYKNKIEHNKLYIDFTFGNTYEKEQIVTSMKEKKLEIGGEYAFKKGFTVGGDIGKRWIKQNNKISQVNFIEFFIRKYW